MKKIIPISFLIFCSLFTANAGTKRALIFAISNYPDNHGWVTPLCGMNDAKKMKSTLEHQGFTDDNITIVADKDATVKGIEDAFTQLIDRSGKGDIVVIHFSCHGQQLASDDPHKISGLDQCVVSYNAVYASDKKDYDKYQGDYLRGHIIGDYLKQLRRKLGKEGDVIVFMDYCHSGAGTRGAGIVRGGLPPMVPEGYTYKADNGDKMDIYREGSTVGRGNDDELATFVVFSATRPEELDFQTTDDDLEDIGSLTYAVTKAFENLDPEHTTYRTFFARIEATMNAKVPSQHPLLEGNGADRLLMGGKYIRQSPYVEISQINPDNRQIVVKGGKIGGLDSGALVDVDAAGTNDPTMAKPLTKGIVISADNYTATIQLDQSINVPKAAAWVFITSPKYQITPVTVTISQPMHEKTRGAMTAFSQTETKEIDDELSTLNVLNSNAKPDLIIVKGVNGEDTLKVAVNGLPYAVVKNVVTNKNDLNDVIKRYTRYKFLTNLKLSEPDISFEVRLLPVVNGKADLEKLKLDGSSGRFICHDGDTIAIWVKNTGTKAAYINILDMQPDGKINPVFPYKDKEIYSYDLKIDPGQERIFDPNSRYNNTIGPPYGTEVFKIFACANEIDVEDLATRHGETSRGNMRVLEQLVKQSCDQTRGVSISCNNKDGTTDDLVFTIEK